MKNLFILHSSMELGGAETSLLGLLQTIDYSQISVTLFLLNPVGELMYLIPSSVHIVSNERYQDLCLPIKEVMHRHHFGVVFARLLGRIRGKKYKSINYMTKHYSHMYSLPFLPAIGGEYDLAISFIDPHYIVNRKVSAPIKMNWLHTDFSRVDVDKNSDLDMWEESDWIVTVSDSCKHSFDSVYPRLGKKSLVVENILSLSFIRQRSLMPESEIIMDNDVLTLLSIGRFTHAKNFDNIPEVASLLLKKGIKIRWYLIGYGGEEQLVRSKIKEFNVEDIVFILGKKDNPYPYINACDIYVQPSRFEGKSVAVREAQLLCKPVLITNYVTAPSQIEDGVDGVICKMDNESIATALFELSNNQEKQRDIISYLEQHPQLYTNESEINKIYRLMNL